MAIPTHVRFEHCKLHCGYQENLPVLSVLAFSYMDGATASMLHIYYEFRMYDLLLCPTSGIQCRSISKLIVWYVVI